jgi:hypothetical protein
LQLLQLMLQFFDLTLHLLHLRLHLLHLIELIDAGLALVLLLLLKARDTVRQAHRRVLSVCGGHKQHGGRQGARHAETGRKAFSQSKHHYSAV